MEWFRFGSTQEPVIRNQSTSRESVMGSSPAVRAATERDIPRLVGLNRLVQDLHVTAHPDVFRPSSDLPGIDDFFF